MIKIYPLSAYVFLILLMISNSFSSEAQRTNFRIYQYNKENKLNEELVKSTQQDSLGTFYFATDDGVLALQNDNFTPLALPEGKSTYFKELFKRRNGDLLAVSDDAIYEINSSLKKAEMKVFIECNTDTLTPKYPKHLFEDQKNDLWISDYIHLYRYQGGAVEKYSMDVKNQSSSYARSFQFLECDNGNLIVISQKGWFYKFDAQKNVFKELKFNLDLIVHSFFKIGANEFLVGTSQGVVKITFDTQGKVIQKDVIIPNIVASCFQRISASKIMIGTWFQGLLELDMADKNSVSNVGGFPYLTINDIFLGDYGKYWVSTNSGAVVLEEKFFSYEFNSSNAEYITSISLAASGEVNFSGQNNVYRPTKQGDIESLDFPFEGTLTVFKNKYDLTLLGTEQGILSIFKGENLLFNISLCEAAITSILIFSEEVAWIVGNKDLFKVNLVTGEVKSYLDSFQGLHIVQDICLDSKQNLYIGGEFTHSYLFKYDSVKDEIINISKPLSFPISEDFWVIDFEMVKDVLYMGTSEGLLKYTENLVERVDLGELTTNEFNSVAIDNQNSIWLTTSNGVVRKRKEDISLFTLDQGLPSKTFINRSLLVDSNNYLWVGTSNGIAFAPISDSILPTPIPLVYMADKDRELVYQNSTVPMEAKSMLLLDVTASIYPQKQNKFQFCTVQGTEEKAEWKELTAKNQILLSGLKAGKYKICIRGKHEGNYSWSEHRIIKLSVKQVWYLRWYTILGELLLVLFLIYLTNEYSKKRTKKNLLALEKLVSDRTFQLQNVNQSLSTANIAKDKFLSIIAHDLRNPFNAIRGFSSILLNDSDILSEEEKNELIETIYRSSDDTYKLLESLLEWANVQKGNFKLNAEEFDLKLLLEKNLGVHKSLGSLKELEVFGNFESAVVLADKAMIDTVIRNIMSNAIKFSFPGQTITLSATILKDKVVVEIKDQGVGMTDKQLKQLFKFDKVFTSEGTANETGTGFGLMLSKEFVELNGGEIWAESEKDKGTSFFFSIPKIK
ncbi:hypothetical protein BZG02_14200 [Labilibaculum filiforme]|uniref:histidine kinase n=1 Tax=Labilibaculum filiforme TaxID=1940526 RepID=A0A2N3HVL8_9BACT|nr:HAMP domain-containing sensor histidine kinase [Labilibaculum filiforme]PKQ62078.1 hypothetical protein BZG02_14200 [Labilibaculum filiforme]